MLIKRNIYNLFIFMAAVIALVRSLAVIGTGCTGCRAWGAGGDIAKPRRVGVSRVSIRNKKKTFFKNFPKNKKEIYENLLTSKRL